MDDIKKAFREGESGAKEGWRKADGEEDLSDKIGNAGDEIRKNLGNAGDDLRNDDLGNDRVDDPNRRL